ncbi:MAG: AAA family ATPase [Pseudobdellovibrionaceae bacterium]|uniref:ArsA family ATPase n=1 Tax=Oligoflexus sp. TaxID=1971216 RepID=UPI0027BF7568|nr:ArsA-related P-loop ATPase [Oligoflexus sp.]MDQ3233301.1 AAA family ATPase [Pseudobdellovibrionaceae bacterium]HYX33023.1 ArsA-related P-loop ATPase [Oligoflexus sp.]
MTTVDQEGLESWLRKSRILVTVGSGGVGKTTTSIALALLGAKLGLRVGLLSIDPAKRLADALGIPLGSELSPVRLQRQVPGHVEAAMLDQKAVFDDMVRRFAPSTKAADRIFNNSIYKEVSTNLGGPLEYMALAKLETMLSQGRYDLIVLDTPPDTHALDFLARPNILHGFIENGVMSWMIKPFHLAQKLGAGAIFKAGGKVMAGISSITGMKMLKLLAEFLVLMEEVIVGFNRVGREVSVALKRNSTGFVLVSAPTDNAVRSAAYLLQELKTNQYPLLTVIMNRNLPFALQEAAEAWNQSDRHWTEIRPGFEVISRRHRYAATQAGKLAAQAQQLFGKSVPLLLLEEQRQMIHSEESLWQFTDALLKARQYQG